MKAVYWKASLGIALLAGCGDAGYGAELSAVYYPGTDEYSEWEENDFIDAREENTSTFSVDVDTASYTIMRRDIQGGILPAPESVRPEEYINYFDYDYVEPTGEHPFSINLEAAPSLFGATRDEAEPTERTLLRIGLRGKHIDLEDLKPTNLVFLVDTSGSMKGEKLRLVEYALHTLHDHLRPDDTVGIVTYAGKEKVLLEPTPASKKARVRRAINNLTGLAGGSTNGEAGIVKAYEMLESVRIEGGNNRVVILTDGDFNVGKSGDELVDFVTQYREKHMSLTAVGVGLGNYKDNHMEGIAQNANGNYFYLDSESEADRIFGRDLASTIEVIAADVKIQVEFNQEVVSRYRLIGYENRLLENEDFEDDKKDAGEIGPDHRVTAYYELELAEEAPQDQMLAEVRLRYKSQYGVDSVEFGQDLKVSNVHPAFDEASKDFQLGAAVAEFAELLRVSKHSAGDGYEEVANIASAASDAPDVKELVELVEQASKL